MSDMSHLTRAYAAVHNTEIKENLSNHRDGISEMDLTQLTDVDLYEVAEEVLEEVFTETSDVADAKKLIEAIFKKALQGDSSPVRTAKLERLGEAFVKAFDRVTEKSIRVAVESYSDYRRGKERLARLNDNPNHDRSKERIHAALVAEDRKIVKDGLLSMIESIGSAIDKTLGAAGEVADTAIKLPAKGVGYLKGLKKGLKKAAKKAETKAAGDASPQNEGYGDKSAGQILAKREKDDNAAGAPKQYTLTKADKTGNTVAWQNRNKKNVKTGEPLYKKADHLKKEETELVDKLVESGKFSGVEIAKIADIQEADIADIIARLEKKRISKGGDPKESPLPAMRKYHADKNKKK